MSSDTSQKSDSNNSDNPELESAPDNRPANAPAPAPSKGFRGFSFARLKRLATKELRETLRDRRTLITLILMPLLVYPILSLVFRTVLMSSLQGSLDNKPMVLRIILESNKPEQFTSMFISELRRRVGTFELAEADANQSELAQNCSAQQLPCLLYTSPSPRD